MKNSTTQFMVLALLFIGHLAFTQDQGLVIRQGHTDAINVVHYSPDGRFVISASADKTIKVWDVNTGIDLKTFAGHPAPITALEMTKDASILLSGDEEGNLFKWNLNGGIDPVFTQKAHEGSVGVIKFFQDETSFLSGGDDNLIKKWSITGDLEKTLDVVQSNISSLAIHPNQEVVLVGGKTANDVDLLLVDIEKNEITDDALKNIKEAGAAKAYTYAVLGGVTAISSIAKGNIGKDMMTMYVFSYSNMEYSKDGSSALISQNLFLPVFAAKGEEEKSGGTTISIIEFEENGRKFKEVRRPKRWSLGYPKSKAVFNQDQTQIIVNHKFSLKVYDMVTAEFPEGSWKEASQYEPPLVKEFIGKADEINSIAISPDYKSVVSADNNQSIKLWDMGTGRIYRNLEGYVQPAISVAAMPDGKHILVGTEGRDMTQWDITTGRMVRTFDRSGTVSSIDVSAEGDMIVTAAKSTSFIKVWNANRGSMLKSILEKDREFTWVKFGSSNEEIYANSINTASGIGLAALKAEEELKIYNRSDGKSKKVKNETIENLETKKNHGAFSISYDGYEVSLLENGNKIMQDRQVGTITDACFSTDGQYLITTNMRGEIALYNVADKKKTISFSLIGDTDYIAYTPDFYYTSSKNAANAIAFRSGLKVLPFEQLELKLNRPDIITDRLGYSSPNLVASYKAAFDKRLKRLGLTEKDLEGKLEIPEVEIQNLEKIPLSTESKDFSFTVSMIDESYGLSKLQVYVNDVPMYGTGGVAINAAKGQRLEKTIPIRLSVDINEIKVVATNTYGLESAPASFEIKYDQGFFKPNLYLVSIGVSAYQNSEKSLQFAAKDARDVAALFEKSTAYENKYIKMLTDQQVTRANILGLRSFIEQADVDDVVVIFIAGHGELDKSYNYYFATHNMDFNNPANGGLLYEDFESLIDGIPCRNKLVFMDTCQSGELDKDDLEETTSKVVKSGKVAFRSGGTTAVQLKANPFGLENMLELSKSLFGDMKKGTGATVISAAAGTELAMEGLNSNNGVFTNALLDGIESRRADINRNRAYSISEIRNYIYEAVVSATNGAQVPTSREENVRNDFRVF